MNRRQFLATGTLGSAAMMLMPKTRSFAQGEAHAAAKASARKPKNIIFMVADGMSIGVPSLADPFSRMVRGKSTKWGELLCDKEITHGLLETHSLSSLVTDSAAAGSTWGSGSRIFNGALNWLPDGTQLTPINTLAKASGKKVGLVTTTTITHATPASFDISAPSRNDQDGIALKYLDSQADVYMGGGQTYLLPGLRKDGKDVLGEFKKLGYATVTDKKGMMAIPADKERIFGVFYPGHLPYTLDHINSEELQAEVPTLAEMAKKAISHLSKGENGFLLQIEGGRVDHAAHANDAASIMWDQLAFDDAVEAVLEIARKDGETLVVITTDHGNSSLALNGMGAGYKDSTECFERLTLASGSYEKMEKEIAVAKQKGTAIDQDYVVNMIDSNIGMKLDPEEITAIVDTVNGRVPAVLNKQHRNFNGVMGEVLSNHNGMAWTGISHTAEYVIMSAVGPGQELIEGLIPNYEIFHLLTGLWDIDHVNPSMTSDEAKKYLADAPVVREQHWA